MTHPIPRRFILAGVAALPLAAQTRKAPDRGPALAQDLVKEFVGAAHGDLDKTRLLLDATPGLLNAAWDWGGGDFETGLGGASHMGRRDIAELLIGRGARMDIFAAAMLGKLAVVEALVAAYPGIENSLGPHKITLLAHARRGGEQAEAVLKFLEARRPA
jgi:hypothetical protein